MAKGLKADRIWGTRQEAMLAIAVATAAGSEQETGAVAAVALMFNSSEETIQSGVDTQRAIQQVTEQRRSAAAQPAPVAANATTGEGVNWV